MRNATLIGWICTLASLWMLLRLALGLPAPGVSAMTGLIGLRDSYDGGLTLLLGLLSLVFGVRALWWKRVCIGDRCSLD